MTTNDTTLTRLKAVLRTLHAAEDDLLVAPATPRSLDMTFAIQSIMSQIETAARYLEAAARLAR